MYLRTHEASLCVISKLYTLKERILSIKIDFISALSEIGWLSLQRK